MKKFKDLSKKQKMLAIPLFAIMLIGSVLATGYIVNSFFLQVDVYEPFEVSYTIIGDAGNYDGVTTCASLENADVWQSFSEGEVVDVEGLFPGEGRKFCVKIDNAGEAEIPYTIHSEVKTGLGNYNDCVLAFPDVTETGTATGEDTTIDGAVILVPADAPPVSDCKIEISVARG